MADEAVLRRCFRCQPERGGKAFWDAEQLDRDLASRWIPRIASEAFCPRKARVRTLRTGKDHIRLTWRSDGGRRQAHLDALVSHELPTGAPVLSAAPVPPEQRRGTHRERVQQNTDPTGLRGGFPMPLARLSQRAAATIENSGTVEDAQTAISLAALLGGAQRLARRTGQRPIGLESEILPAETTRFPGQGDRRFAIALHRCLLRCGLGDQGSKLSCAQRSWRELMTQFQPEVPHPLRDDLPDFLSRGRVTTPAVGILLLVFIGEHCFKGATMQVKRHHVGGGECVLREIGEKEFVDHPLADVTDAALFLGCWVGSHHDTAAGARLPHRDIGAVVELPLPSHFLGGGTAGQLASADGFGPTPDPTRCNLCRA